MKLHSPLCDLFDIEYPVVLAGMGSASTPELAAAVSNAGGLGVIGAAALQPETLREWIRRTRSLTDKPFGVDTLLPASVRRAAAQREPGDEAAERAQLEGHLAFARQFMAQENLEPVAESRRRGSGGLQVFSKEFFEAQMAVVIEERVPVYAAGLGNPGPWMKELHANGTRVLAVVGAVRHAAQVISVGIDAIVAQGHDAGGHNSPVGAMALIPQVVDAVGDTPVLGAGGIGDGRGVAAAMMLGAAGAWIGTAFLAAEESGIAPHQKQALVDGTEEGTVISKSVTGKPARIIRSKWTDAWERASISPLPMPYQGVVSGPVMAAANAAGRADINPGFAGQGMGMIARVRPAAEIFDEIVASAIESLEQARSLLD